MNKYKFNVIYYDINKDKMTEYDIIPYLMHVYNKTENKPKTLSELKAFILSESKYHWWARCEYEIIISSWPKGTCEEKWDIFRQIEMNIDVITNILANAISEE